MKKITTICTLLSVLTLIFSAAVFAAGTKESENAAIALKLGHQINEGSPEATAATAFANAVREKSKNRMGVTVFPGEQLGAAGVMVESAMLGTLDIALVAGQFLSGYDKTLNLVTIPYFFKDPATYQNVIAEAGLAEKQSKALSDKNLLLLNTKRNFFRGDRLIASKKPIRTVEDFKGLRFRTFENAVYVESYKRLGTNPLVVPWGETFSALKQGIVEASCGSIDQIYSMNFAEVCKYITWTYEYYTEVLMVMNKNTFSKLSPEYQQILIDAANAAGDVMKAEVEKSANRDIERIKAKGAEFINMDTAPLRKTLIPYYYELEKGGTIPQGVVDKILANG
jgi:tripartite ATP-independent transporter DctP family solute receptor